MQVIPWLNKIVVLVARNPFKTQRTVDNSNLCLCTLGECRSFRLQVVSPTSRFAYT